MDLNININLGAGEQAALEKSHTVKIAHSLPHNEERLAKVESLHEDMRERMEEDFKPFPKAFLGAYMSHFRITLEFNALASLEGGGVVSVVSPPAAQTVAWSDPFIYKTGVEHEVEFPLPAQSKLPRKITEKDFLAKPPGYYVDGRETMWLQILNLDAVMESRLGPIRIILGETLLREYPASFRPSLGVATSLGKTGFPARLFFNPYAIIETQFGSFRAIHGTLSYGRVTAFPPVGTPVSISDCIPLESTAEVAAKGNDPQPIGRIVALSHPIDMALQIQGEEAYSFVERLVAKQPRSFAELKGRPVALPKIDGK